ncbi:hypothetical protein E1161_14985 [Saccharopolyspora aridisoli]|uniref:Mycothiol-dependent maleylpyruvate isomerase metal-binding domain-containing protein n=1 Tax=Saccharopolyspora aridisoli TaxID=2530385 RepID=A0A4R4UIV5_9PSEU|nr:hypothetical protein E1161_14985 [Saccharopolyspora aridisoli]
MADLADDDLMQPSGCRGWLVRDLVRHLITTDAQDVPACTRSGARSCGTGLRSCYPAPLRKANAEQLLVSPRPSRTRGGPWSGRSGSPRPAAWFDSRRVRARCRAPARRTAASPGRRSPGR